MTLFVYGDVNRDLCLTVREMPLSGGDAEVTEMAFTPGGSAANTACIAARLGIATEFIGLLGDDDQSEMLLHDLLAHGVGIKHLRRVAGFSGMIAAIIESSGERTFLSYRGVNARQPYSGSAEELPIDLLQRGDTLHLSGYSFQADHSREMALKLMARARQVGAHLSLDPSYLFSRDYADDALINGLDYLFPNGEEARLLTGCHQIEAAAEALAQRGVAIVAIKAGAQGCYLRTPTLQRWIPAYPVSKVLDTIGAGDAFCGGFVAAALRGYEPLFAAQIGLAAASQVIQHIGGHSSAPTWEQALEIVGKVNQ